MSQDPRYQKLMFQPDRSLAEKNADWLAETFGGDWLKRLGLQGVWLYMLTSGQKVRAGRPGRSGSNLGNDDFRGRAICRRTPKSAAARCRQLRRAALLGAVGGSPWTAPSVASVAVIASVPPSNGTFAPLRLCARELGLGMQIPKIPAFRLILLKGRSLQGQAFHFNINTPRQSEVVLAAYPAFSISASTPTAFSQSWVAACSWSTTWLSSRFRCWGLPGWV